MQNCPKRNPRKLNENEKFRFIDEQYVVGWKMMACCPSFISTCSAIAYKFDSHTLQQIKNEMPEGISFLCVDEEGVRTLVGSSRLVLTTAEPKTKAESWEVRCAYCPLPASRQAQAERQ